VELFHLLAHRPSAAVRRFIVDQGLEEAVRFRNVSFPKAGADFRAKGGSELPALWDGARMIVGVEAIMARLLAHKDVGRD
jgi:hypothetical protein